MAYRQRPFVAIVLEAECLSAQTWIPRAWI